MTQYLTKSSTAFKLASFCILCLFTSFFPWSYSFMPLSSFLRSFLLVCHLQALFFSFLCFICFPYLFVVFYAFFNSSYCVFCVFFARFLTPPLRISARFLLVFVLFVSKDVGSINIEISKTVSKKPFDNNRLRMEASVFFQAAFHNEMLLLVLLLLLFLLTIFFM